MKTTIQYFLDITDLQAFQQQNRILTTCLKCNYHFELDLESRDLNFTAKQSPTQTTQFNGR